MSAQTPEKTRVEPSCERKAQRVDVLRAFGVWAGVCRLLFGATGHKGVVTGSRTKGTGNLVTEGPRQLQQDMVFLP